MNNIKPASIVNRELLDMIINGKQNYFSLLHHEWKIMKDAIDATDDLKLISSIDQMDPTKINIYPNIEGAHSFIHLPKDPDDVIDDGYDRLRNFIRTHSPAYLTLTHITNKLLFTHCYGLKLATKEELVDSDFYPMPMGPKGYSRAGEKILNVCLEENLPIDLKHKGPLGRLSIYDHLRARKAEFAGIMSSHAGIAGTSYKTFLKEYLVTRDREPTRIKNKIFLNRGQHIVKLLFNRKMAPWD